MQKWGKKNGIQEYKCQECFFRFRNKRKRKQCPHWIPKAYSEYSSGKQTLQELSKVYGRNRKTIQKYFDLHFPCTGEVTVHPHPVCVVLDATFFGRRYGILVARSGGRNLLWKEIHGEKIRYYEGLLDDLVFAGFSFSAFVIDGRRGVRNLLEQKFPSVPIQLCQFHQIQTITRHLSRKPKLEAGKELREIALTLTKTRRDKFSEEIQEWHKKWEDFLKEKTVNHETKRWNYTHKRLRSAYTSLKNNLPWLFSFQDFPGLHIPNTTNSYDGSFAHWKNKIKIHRGLSKERRKKMIDYFLENS